MKLLFSENVLPYLLKTAKDLFTHSRDKHIFNQYFEEGKKYVKRRKKNAVHLKWNKPKLVKFTFQAPNWTKSWHTKNYCFLKFEANRINKLIQKWYWILGINPKKNVNKNLLLTHWDCYTKKILYFEIGSKQVANNGNNFCNKNHQTKRKQQKRQVESKDPPSENKQKQTANSIILPHITTC